MLMYFFIQSGCFGRSNHSKYILEIINFWQLVHAINIGRAHENKFKLHKNVSLIKFRAIKIRPLSFSRTLLELSAF